MRLGVGHDVHGLLRGVERDLFRSASLCSGHDGVDAGIVCFMDRAPGILVGDFPEGGALHGALENHVFDGHLCRALAIHDHLCSTLLWPGSRQSDPSEFLQHTLDPNSVESPGHVRARDGNFHAAIDRKEPRHREVGQRVPRPTAFGVGELVWSKSNCATDVRLNQREQQMLGNLRQLGSQVYAYAVAGRENGFLFADGYHPMNTPRLRPRSCLYHALQQGLHRLGQLLRAAFEDACRDEVGTNGAFVAETSKHSHALLRCRAGDGRLELNALGTLCV